MSIRMATLADIPQILDIYGPYVLETAISFEYTVPTPEAFTRRFLHHTERFPWLVWEENGEILLTLVINGGEIPYRDELVKRLTEAHGKIVGIQINENTRNTNVILGDEFVTLWGKDYITDTLSGVKLDITAPSFYQVNHDCAELLYKKAKVY